jgi:hypothetical protein
MQIDDDTSPDISLVVEGDLQQFGEEIALETRAS